MPRDVCECVIQLSGPDHLFMMGRDWELWQDLEEFEISGGSLLGFVGARCIWDCSREISKSVSSDPARGTPLGSWFHPVQKE